MKDINSIYGGKTRKLDLTYGGKIKGLINAIYSKNFDVNYTIESDTGETTTTSILIDSDDKGNLLMITFNYQDLKKLVEEKIKGE